MNRRSIRWWLGLPIGAGAVYLMFAALYAFYSRPPAGPWTFATSFESGALTDIARPGMRQMCCAHSARIVESPARDGRYALQVRLEAHEPTVRGNYRAEVRLPSTPIGSTNDYAFSVFVPLEWKDDSTETVVAQWHSVPDRWLGEAYLPSPLHLGFRAGSWNLSTAWDDRRVIRFPLGRSLPRNHLYPLTLPAEKGRWVDWSFHVRWAYDHSGLLVVRKDGAEVLRREGPNTYNDAIGPYFKFGVYAQGWLGSDAALRVDSKTLYFDAITVRQGR